MLRDNAMTILLRTLAAGLVLVMAPAFAQESLTYECEDPTGFEVLAWVTLTGTHYAVETQMQVSGEGEIAFQQDGNGLVILSGPLARDFSLLGAKPVSGSEMTFVDERGPVMICRLQRS